MLSNLKIIDRFACISTFDDVSHGKPAPDIFLRNSEILKIPPNECVVIEDAVVGIEAAKNAGMKVIAVATKEKIDNLNVEMIKKL